jgi:hypothetical protein
VCQKLKPILFIDPDKLTWLIPRFHMSIALRTAMPLSHDIQFDDI